MMVEEQTRDIMRRTVDNLRFVEANARPHGPFEITQLLNSFLGILVHPWERRERDNINMDTDRVAWPNLSKESPNDAEPRDRAQSITWIRHAFAHGNIELLPGPPGEIGAIRLWNNRDGRRHWGVRIDIATLRQLLFAFADLAELAYDQATLSTHSRSNSGLPLSPARTSLE